MPRHFIVTSTADGTVIRPFSSDAVVSLNGRQLSLGATALSDGDIIAAGSGQFRFWSNTPSESRGPLPSVVPAPACLVDGVARGALSLNRTSTGIGGDESNALVVKGTSSFEAEIRREAGGHALRTSSASSVRVNGRPVSAPVLLAEGDEIQVGNRVLRYTREPLADLAPARDSESEIQTIDLTPPAVEEEAYARTPADSAALALRNPMRAVAFVSSLIAAVAIATLVILHRGP
jgi:hypothetical protein